MTERRGRASIYCSFPRCCLEPSSKARLQRLAFAMPSQAGGAIVTAMAENVNDCAQALARIDRSKIRLGRPPDSEKLRAPLTQKFVPRNTLHFPKALGDLIGDRVYCGLWRAMRTAHRLGDNGIDHPELKKILGRNAQGL